MIDRTGNQMKKDCCCLFNALQMSLVLEVSISAHHLDGSCIMYMDDFRSWMQTKLFLKGLNLASKTEDFQDGNEFDM